MVLQFSVLDPLSALRASVLITLVVAAAWIDVKEHRIPNALVFPGLVSALLMAHLPGGTLASWTGGLAMGLAAALPIYWLHAMGAGDVKLMGMVGSFLGAPEMFTAALIIFLTGGVLAILAAYRQKALPQLASNMKQMFFGGIVNSLSGAGSLIDAPVRSVGVQPYGVAIAIGTVIYLSFKWGGIFQ